MCIIHVQTHFNSVSAKSTSKWLDWMNLIAMSTYTFIFCINSFQLRCLASLFWVGFCPVTWNSYKADKMYLCTLLNSLTKEDTASCWHTHTVAVGSVSCVFTSSAWHTGIQLFLWYIKSNEGWGNGPNGTHQLCCQHLRCSHVFCWCMGSVT